MAYEVSRTLNAISGLGICIRGLNMIICNIIFSSVVIPIVLYGCELCRINHESVSLLESFLNDCKRIQRFVERHLIYELLKYSWSWLGKIRALCAS